MEEGGADGLPAKARVERRSGTCDQPKGGDAGGAGGGFDGGDEALRVAAAAISGRDVEVGEPGREVGAGVEAARGEARRAGGHTVRPVRDAGAGGKQDEAVRGAEGGRAAIAEPGLEGGQEIGVVGERDEGEGGGHGGPQRRRTAKTPRAWAGGVSMGGRLRR